MTLTQQIEHIREDRFRNEIVIHDVTQGFFPAIISNSIEEGKSKRIIAIHLLPMEQSPGGSMNCDTGRFIRRSYEMGIEVKLSQNGNTLATSYAAYDEKSNK